MRPRPHEKRVRDTADRYRMSILGRFFAPDAVVPPVIGERLLGECRFSNGLHRLREGAVSAGPIRAAAWSSRVVPGVGWGRCGGHVQN